MNNARIAGAILISTSLGFIAVFNYLAAHFGYPQVLQGPATEVLPAFLAGGNSMRTVWAIYAALPAGIALSAILSVSVFRQRGDTSAHLGMIAAVVSTAAMTAGLARWPTINYLLAQRFAEAGSAEQQTLAAVFDAGNLYLGTVIGEFIGELALSVWFCTMSLAILRGVGMWRWTGYLGLFTAASMSLGAFRNVAPWLAGVAALNNSLLPIWLITLGAALIAPAPNTAAIETAQVAA